MNKSLVLKNKFYLFFLLIFSFFLFVYLLYFLINGDKGIISYYKIKNKNLEYDSIVSKLEKKNYLIWNKISRLQTNTIDLDFLDEKIREKTGYLEENEILIKLD